MASDTFNARTPATTVAERLASGKARRAFCPRTTLARWEPSVNRRDPVSLIQDQESARLPALLPLRYARMSVSAFAFYRGTAAIMAADLAAADNSGLLTQLCGDAHVANFGLFASPERSVVFDVNDFDETSPGPFEWDVARLTTSLLLASRANGFSARQCEAITRTAATEYRRAIGSFADMNDLDIWYSRVEAGTLTAIGKAQAGARAKTAVTEGVRAAMQRDRWSAIRKLTISTDQGRRFIDQPPFLVSLNVDDGWWDRLQGIWQTYHDSLPLDRQKLLDRYRAVDLAHKVVGVGSVGLRAYIVLLQGRDEGDLLVLQAKQAVDSVVAARLPHVQVPSHQGERVVFGQRLMQAATDIFLGWTTGPLGRDYYVRQLRDMKWSPDLSQLGPPGLRALASSCAHTLARAHARSGDSIAISGYLGSTEVFADAMVTFAKRYAEQVNADFALFQAALASGRLTATGSATGRDPAALGDQIRAELRSPSGSQAGQDPTLGSTPA